MSPLVLRLLLRLTCKWDDIPGLYSSVDIFVGGLKVGSEFQGRYKSYSINLTMVFTNDGK